MSQSRISSSPSKPVTPLAYEKIALLGLILFANNASIWMIFSFLPFMVQYYFAYLSKAELGYYAGMLGSAFSCGALLGNLIWGAVSDKWGRRPALLLGLLGTGRQVSLLPSDFCFFSVSLRSFS
jgi:MFS family permease